MSYMCQMLCLNIWFSFSVVKVRRSQYLPRSRVCVFFWKEKAERHKMKLCVVYFDFLYNLEGGLKYFFNSGL